MEIRTITVSAICTMSAEAHACVGEDDHGVRWAWLSSDPCRTGVNQWVEVREDELLPCSREVQSDVMAAVLASWPAWRVAEWAGLGVGSGVVIGGSSRLARPLARLFRARGVGWRAFWAGSQPEEPVEYWIPSLPGQSAEKVLQALPGRPDSVVLIDAAAEEILTALGLCRDGGTVVVAGVGASAQRIDVNLYPDVHWRGLRVRFGIPWRYTSRDAEAWQAAAPRMAALVERGVVLPEGK